MSFLTRPIFASAALLSLALLAAPPALAQPDVSGSTTITSDTCENLSLGALCAGPLFVADKSFEVFTDTNPLNPVPTPGEFTYVYTITNTAASAVPFGAIVRFEISTAGTTSSAGALAGPGVVPSATDLNPTIVRWRFEVDAIDAGETSQKLFLVSDFGPGLVSDSTIAVGSIIAVDQQDTCVGPFEEPGDEVGEPMACTIGFW